MIEPGDIQITQGLNTPSKGWTFLVTLEPRVLFDLTDKTVHLKITWRGGSIERNSEDDPTSIQINVADGRVVYNPTVAESLAMPLGRRARYRLEWHQDSTQGKLASGFVVVGDGMPDIT